MPAATYGRSDADTRRRLAAVREDISTARDKRAEARQARDAAREKFAAASRTGPITEWPEFKAAQDSVAKVGEIEERLSTLVAEENDILSDLGMAQPGHENGAPVGFLADPETRHKLSQMSATSMPLGRVDLGFSSDREAIVERIGMMAAAPDTDVPSDTSRRSANRGITPYPRRALRLLDVIPSAPMEGSGFDYLQETPTANAAAETVEGAVKPPASFVFEDAEAKAKTIAHYTKLKRQTLSDVPALEGVIRNRLERGVFERLEAQIVAGNGTGENIRGILNTTGVAAPDVSALDNTMDAVLEGIVDVLMIGALPNASLVNPRDWADALRAKASGDGHYLSVGPFADAVERMWSAPTIPTAAVPQGKAIVGDFALAATVLVREGVQVLASDSDQDDFVRNRVTLLGEGRFAFVVWQPAAISVVDLTTITP